jgi:oxygen-independent coproporphyrinogen-3 oxidase
VTGLYVHVPFCVSKCAYCDFYSLPNRLDLVPAYIDAVLTEARPRAGMSFDTLYLGGGTPSLLGAANLEKLIRDLKDVFDLSRLAEATIEVNPESASKDLLRTALDLGFTRVSVGVQSLSDRELRSVGRVHTAAQAVAAVSRVVRMGFRDVSADVIVGLPGQTLDGVSHPHPDPLPSRERVDSPSPGGMELEGGGIDARHGESLPTGFTGSLTSTLDEIVELGISHLSVYCLSLEHGTPLAAKPPEDLPTEDDQADLFDEACSLLERQGFVHYEISNFCLPGRECRHNLNYWRGGEYLGLGPAAASHLGGRRWKNRADLSAYLRSPTGVVDEVEELGLKEKASEEAILRLRLLVEGLAAEEMVSRLGEVETQDLLSRLNGLVAEGLLTCDGSRYRLARSRVLTSNPILARVLA